MRLSLLALPLICLAACNSEAPRAPSASASVSTPSAPAAAPSTPTVSTPVVATPTPATVVAAATPVAAPAAKSAPSPVSADLSKFSGPTENAEHFGYDEGSSRIFFYSGGAVAVPVKLAADGDYEIVVSAACDEADGQKAKFSVSVDGQIVAEEVTCTATDAKEYVVKAPGLKAGERKISFAFLNDIYKEGEYDLNFFVHGVTLRAAK